MAHQPNSNNDSLFVPGLIVGLVLLILTIGLVGGTDAFGGSDSSEPEFAEDEDQFSAYEACKSFVSDRLRAPGTASYPNFLKRVGTEIFISDTTDGYVITSHVDAENAFGGEVRTSWVCTVRNQGETWGLESVDLVS